MFPGAWGEVSAEGDSPRTTKDGDSPCTTTEEERKKKRMLSPHIQQNSHPTAQSVPSTAPLISRKVAKVKGTPGAEEN